MVGRMTNAHLSPVPIRSMSPALRLRSIRGQAPALPPRPSSTSTKSSFSPPIYAHRLPTRDMSTDQSSFDASSASVNDLRSFSTSTSTSTSIRQSQMPLSSSPEQTPSSLGGGSKSSYFPTHSSASGDSLAEHTHNPSTSASVRSPPRLPPRTLPPQLIDSLDDDDGPPSGLAQPVLPDVVRAPSYGSANVMAPTKPVQKLSPVKSSSLGSLRTVSSSEVASPEPPPAAAPVPALKTPPLLRPVSASHPWPPPAPMEAPTPTPNGSSQASQSLGVKVPPVVLSTPKPVTATATPTMSAPVSPKADKKAPPMVPIKPTRLKSDPNLGSSKA
jgi:hypothetical protein